MAEQNQPAVQNPPAVDAVQAAVAGVHITPPLTDAERQRLAPLVNHVNMSRAQLVRAYGGLNIIGNLWGTNTDLLPAAATRAGAESLMPYIMILSKGEAYLLQVDAGRMRVHTRCIAVANSMVKSVGDQMPRVEATNRGVQQVVAFLKNDIARGVEDMVSISPEVLQADFEGRPEWLPRTRDELAALAVTEAMTVDSVVRVMNWLYDHIKPSAKSSGAIIYTLGFLALAKRGTISDRKLSTVMSQMTEQGLRVVMDISAEEVKMCYTQVMSKVPHEHVAYVFDHWLTLLGDNCLRMQLILSQAKNSGITILACIKQALMMFPTFPLGQNLCDVPK
ncbi:ORF3 [Lonestar tick chuvirus 1]|uniref:ORF3 n=1 Tax=Lonestar tick chuvirus 1 TaxID=1844927 RepID=A0A172MHQ4_9VIRU|nr:ORF3 [Lonestar tick chuvirus 1]ANC97699.1 ORF3 [Lonestar tick chuvirus 1]